MAGLASACGQIPPEFEVGEFGPYVDRFIQHSLSEGASLELDSGLRMSFSDQLRERENGVCILRRGDTPEVLIKPAAWDAMSEDAREALIFHELGHCLIYRLHENSVDQNGKPVSVMHAYRLRDDVYVEKRDDYREELFSRTHEIY